eukprot:1139201-Pelagomonas_calceolata.AAC.7
MTSALGLKLPLGCLMMPLCQILQEGTGTEKMLARVVQLSREECRHRRRDLSQLAHGASCRPQFGIDLWGATMKSKDAGEWGTVPIFILSLFSGQTLHLSMPSKYLLIEPNISYSMHFSGPGMVQELPLIAQERGSSPGGNLFSSLIDVGSGLQSVCLSLSAPRSTDLQYPCALWHKNPAIHLQSWAGFASEYSFNLSAQT